LLLQVDLGTVLSNLANQGAKFDKTAYLFPIKVSFPYAEHQLES